MLRYQNYIKHRTIKLIEAEKQGYKHILNNQIRLLDFKTNYVHDTQFENVRIKTVPRDFFVNEISKTKKIHKFSAKTSESEVLQRITGKECIYAGFSDKSESLYSKRYLFKFVVHQRNLGTTMIENIVFREIGVRFNYYGRKDKVGCTTQVCGIYGDIWKMLKLLDLEREFTDIPSKALGKNGQGVRSVSYFRISDLEIFDAETDSDFESEQINIGQLYGNKFSIILRGFDPSQKPDFEKQIKNWSETGFLNYYGNQRFNMNDITFKIWSTYDHLVPDSEKTETFYKKLSLGILDYYSTNLSLKETERTFLPWSYKKLWRFGRNDYNLRKILKGKENGDNKLLKGGTAKSNRRATDSHKKNWRGVPIPNNLKQKLNPHGSFGIDGLYQNAYNFSSKRVPDENYYRDLWFVLIGGAQGWKLNRERNHFNFSGQTITSFLFNLGVSHSFLNENLESQFLKESEMKNGMREIIKNSGIFEENLVEISDQYLDKIIKALTIRPLVEKPENVSFEWISHKSEFDVLQVSDYEKVAYGVSDGELVEDGGFLSAKIEFELKKGTYATVALAQLLNSAAVMNPVSEHV